MKKWLSIIILATCILTLSACSNLTFEEELKKWDFSVLCTEKSTADAYIITYSDEQIISKSGTLSFQNQNDFDIVIHLLNAGNEERTVDIAAGGTSVLYQVEKEVAYTIGCHADVEENTEIKLMVYDGERAEIY